MHAAEAVFWACALLVLYPYLLYPLFIAALARLFGRPVRRGQGVARTVSFVVCAHDEEGRIDRRLSELLAILDGTGTPGEVILVSDGSGDRTADIARGYSRVKLVELPERVGKAVALSRGVEAATGEIVVFA